MSDEDLNQSSSYYSSDADQRRRRLERRNHNSVESSSSLSGTSDDVVNKEDRAASLAKHHDEASYQQLLEMNFHLEVQLEEITDEIRKVKETEDMVTDSEDEKLLHNEAVDVMHLVADEIRKELSIKGKLEGEIGSMRKKVDTYRCHKNKVTKQKSGPSADEQKSDLYDKKSGLENKGGILFCTLSINKICIYTIISDSIFLVLTRFPRHKA